MVLIASLEHSDCCLKRSSSFHSWMARDDFDFDRWDGFASECLGSPDFRVRRSKPRFPTEIRWCCQLFQEFLDGPYHFSEKLFKGRALRRWSEGFGFQ
jgi:hypothetical protein